jgi:hypothetical protein
MNRFNVNQQSLQTQNVQRPAQTTRSGFQPRPSTSSPINFKAKVGAPASGMAQSFGATRVANNPFAAQSMGLFPMPAPGREPPSSPSFNPYLPTPPFGDPRGIPVTPPMLAPTPIGGFPMPAPGREPPSSPSFNPYLPTPPFGDPRGLPVTPPTLEPAPIGGFPMPAPGRPDFFIDPAVQQQAQLQQALLQQQLLNNSLGGSPSLINMLGAGLSPTPQTGVYGLGSLLI